MTFLPYKKNLVTSLKRNSAQTNEGYSKKAGTGSKNKESLKEAKEPKAQKVPGSEHSSDCDSILVRSESRCDIADDEDAECLFCTCLYSQEQRWEWRVQCFKRYHRLTNVVGLKTKVCVPNMHRK
jgi:hypothetical protein